MTDLIEDLYKMSTVMISMRHVFSLRPRKLEFTLEDTHNMKVLCVDNSGEYCMMRSYALSRDFFVPMLEEVGNFLHSPCSYGTPNNVTYDANTSPLPDPPQA